MVLSINPFATKESIKAKFIEHTQKEDYSDEVFAFIQKTMQERSEKEWQKPFKAMPIDRMILQNIPNQTK